MTPRSAPAGRAGPLSVSSPRCSAALMDVFRAEVTAASRLCAAERIRKDVRVCEVTPR